MNRKHITTIAIIGALIFSTPNFAALDNPITSMVMNNWNRARNWTNNFYITCRDVGVLATIYATFGMYDFNRITGLDEKKLDTYDANQLKKAHERIEAMNTYIIKSSTYEPLNNFSIKIQGMIQQKEHNAQAAADEAKMMEEASISYDEATVIEDIKKMIAEKRAVQQKK